ncbi:hypothetical protein [Paractinoplanes brasiliensis]|uniref:Uncharacterized protein n=1 Tax=Paractinoplanes brasiliensis TaxID=52695 RepID=A0A4R6JPF7_9ACTN|nr:hypothetical protein [Actinoplanes brasiliensis]TDO38344.1 hypothetical protein C8E87_1997 [Actinoplanes brasiliensis]GID26879.1 hypothetical protein Abr02nite_18620 [Actinoplanes brasiliensis]
MTDEHEIDRGAAEEGAGSPLTPTEVQASRRPPSEPDPERFPSGDDREAE